MLLIYLASRVITPRFLEAFSQVLILHFIVSCLLFEGHYIYLYIKTEHNSMPCIMMAVPGKYFISRENGFYAFTQDFMKFLS